MLENSSSENLSSNALIPPAGDGTASGTVNSPDVSPRTLKPRRRAISDVQHIFQIISTLEEARRDQNEKNGRILAKYNSERPFSADELKENGLDWKSNFSTKPLSTAIDKVSPRLTKVVETARFLTAAKFPENHPGGKEKSEMFRQKITDVIRGWEGWTDFLNEVAQENAVFGFTSVAHLDEFSWKPTHFRQDEFFVPDGTGQNVTSLQLWIGKKYVMIHELAEYIQNRDAAEAAGWDINNTVAALNAAAPRSVSAGGQASPYTDARAYEDAIRESSVSLSLLSGSKTIEIYHVYVPEYDGKVSHYVVDGRAKKILFEKLDQFDTISDAINLFSFQQANGKLMGSKGIGRELYELAGAVDRARNEVVDRLQLSGKIIIQGEPRTLNRFAMSVIGNAVLIPANYTIAKQSKIEPNVEAFAALDQQLVSFMDQIAGGVTPKAFGNERTTAAEVNTYAAREEEKRDAILERFLKQVGKLISTCQRRIVSPKVDDADAKEAREYLLNYMSAEELVLIAKRPALRTVDDWTELEAQKLALLAQEVRADPLYNQAELQRLKVTALHGAELADRILLPDPDPTVVAEQGRQQDLENLLLAKGKPVQVSPRDNHQVHIDVIKPNIEVLAQSLQQPTPEALAIMQLVLQHWSDHIAAAVGAGADKALYAEDMRQIREVANQVGQLTAVLEAQKMQQERAAQSGIPPMAPGAGVSAGPNELPDV